MVVSSFEVAEAGIADLRRALDDGRITSVGLVEAYLRRIEAYDRSGPMLNSVVVDNPAAMAEAAASDRRRSGGQVLGPLDGIPYTAKDSYPGHGSDRGGRIARIRRSDRPPGCLRHRAVAPRRRDPDRADEYAADGQRRYAARLYGRAESPYNDEFLTSAFGSGSSNGSGTATAASFAAFGLGEETWSSGRAPATNNALCAYTPSRGVISVRGNWPLVPTMDVVVPHTRTMADMFEVLDIVVADDPETRGDFWRMQPWVRIPRASSKRPRSYQDLAPGDRDGTRRALAGKRFGVPRMYVNADPEAGVGEGLGIGGPTGQRIETRQSVIDLFAAAGSALTAAGAEVVLVDFPVVSNYERDRAGVPSIKTRGLVSPEFLEREVLDLSAWAWDDFLRANGDPAIPDLAAVDGSRIWVNDPGALPDRVQGFGEASDDINAYPAFIREHPIGSFLDIPHLEQGLRGLERTRRVDLEEWMHRRGLDAVIFPTVADVGPADMDVNRASADLGWRNGVWVANGNLVPRHLGIPTVTVPMGVMADIGMPVGLTFAGRAYDDAALLRFAAAFEATGARRTAPPRTPPL